MAYFPHKHFNGTTYLLDHLEPTSIRIALDVANTLKVSIQVQYSCHCFTEAFDPERHRDHHRYTHRGETRAFNILRYQCSLQLPSLLNGLPRRTVYRAEQDNYTYVALIPVNQGVETYSVFFKLTAKAPAQLHMRVQSAYLKPLSRKPKESWRFGSLAGQISGVFDAPGKRPRPKKKAP